MELKAGNMGVKLTAKSKNFLQANLAVSDESADPVIKKIYKTGKREPNPLYGFYETSVNGKKVIVEYEPDTSLRDSEQVPLLEEGGIDSFMKREVLPYAPDAWVDGNKTQIGYEISFTKYFYKPIELRSIQDILADLKAVEIEADGIMEEIIGELEE